MCSSRSGLCVCACAFVPCFLATLRKSLHWGLSPGPSVYKTDALPLSYRGLCRTGRLACVCNYDLRIHALVHLCRANAECPYPLCAVCWSQTCVVQERQLATMNDPVQVQSFPPVQANAICVLCEAMTCLTARPGPLFKRVPRWLRSVQIRLKFPLRNTIPSK